MAPGDDADAEQGDDRRAFLDAMEGVTPLREKHAPARYKHPPVRYKHLPDGGASGKRPLTEGQRRRQSDAVREERPHWDHGIAQLQPHEAIEWRGNGVSRETLRRFGHDHRAVAATLDLHYKRVEEAKRAVSRFLTIERQRGSRVVCIIHGRGESSETPARIKSHVAHWLRQHSAVLAYKSAPAANGGAGATWVLLKRADKQKSRR